MQCHDKNGSVYFMDWTGPDQILRTELLTHLYIAQLAVAMHTVN